MVQAQASSMQACRFVVRSSWELASMLHHQCVWRRRALAALLVLGACTTTTSADVTTINGQVFPLGNGSVNTYLVLEDGGVPVALGIRMSETALDGLPAKPNDTDRCFDMDGDGKHGSGECVGEYETVMLWPEEASQANLPFKWMGLGWNAHGHAPPGVYDKPHFDVHFYMVDKEAIDAIRPGTCGIMVDCEDFERAVVPVPPVNLPAGYADVGAVVPAMGNHLVNTASPELATPPEAFTHTLIYGAYDGRIIFLEPMATREFLAGRPDLCAPIVQPEQWETSGFLPTEYCIRYLPDESALTVSLEGFVAHR